MMTIDVQALQRLSPEALIAHFAPERLPTMTTTERLASHGFYPVDLSHGFTGYLRTDGQTSELIQSADPSVLPKLADVCDVYVTIGNVRSDDVTFGTPTRARLSRIMAALADARAEYTLIDLRLHNGYGDVSPVNVFDPDRDCLLCQRDGLSRVGFTEITSDDDSGVACDQCVLAMTPDDLDRWNVSVFDVDDCARRDVNA